MTKMEQIKDIKLSVVPHDMCNNVIPAACQAGARSRVDMTRRCKCEAASGTRTAYLYQRATSAFVVQMLTQPLSSC